MEDRDSFIPSPDGLVVSFYHCSREATLTWIKGGARVPDPHARLDRSVLRDCRADRRQADRLDDLVLPPVAHVRSSGPTGPSDEHPWRAGCSSDGPVGPERSEE